MSTIRASHDAMELDDQLARAAIDRVVQAERHREEQRRARVEADRQELIEAGWLPKPAPPRPVVVRAPARAPAAARRPTSAQEQPAAARTADHSRPRATGTRGPVVPPGAVILTREEMDAVLHMIDTHPATRGDR